MTIGHPNSRRAWSSLLLVLAAAGCAAPAAERALRPHEVRPSEVFETTTMRFAAPTSGDWFVVPSVHEGSRTYAISHFASNRQWDLAVSLSEASGSVAGPNRDNALVRFQRSLREDLGDPDLVIEEHPGTPDARFGDRAWLFTLRGVSRAGPVRTGSVTVLAFVRSGHNCLLAFSERSAPGRSAAQVAGYWADLLDLLTLVPAGAPSP
jgi:hypothetical protein